jgi:serine protease inhibitor
MANPQNRDFGDGETRDVINKWADDHTEGMIKEVLSEQEFDPLAVSYLLNAIYFKGLWSCPFEAEATKEERFDGGNPVPMMRNVFEMEYAEDELCQSVVLPYGNGSYQMQVFLPREGKTLDELAESLSGKNWRMRGRSCEVDLKLPRFEIVTNINLKPVMTELGMPTAFDPENADFSELCVDNFGENIYIALMKQVAKIEVNEQGTKAAAVTVIGMGATGMPKTATFHANRPFLYVISEQSTGIILFMGQYLGEGIGTGIKDIDHSPLTIDHSPFTIDHCVYDLQGRRIGNGQSSMVNGQSSMVNGQSSMVNGQSSMVNGQSSMVNGQSSMVNGQSSMVNGQLRKGLYIVDGRKVIVR